MGVFRHYVAEVEFEFVGQRPAQMFLLVGVFQQRYGRTYWILRYVNAHNLLVGGVEHVPRMIIRLQHLIEVWSIAL